MRALAKQRAEQTVKEALHCFDTICIVSVTTDMLPCIENKKHCLHKTQVYRQLYFSIPTIMLYLTRLIISEVLNIKTF